jgi:hypothetical protein
MNVVGVQQVGCVVEGGGSTGRAERGERGAGRREGKASWYDEREGR